MNLRLMSLLASCIASAMAFGADSEPAAAGLGASVVAVDTRAAGDPLLAELTRQLSARFQVRGELQVDLLRAWTLPASAVSGVGLLLVECPGRLTSSLLVRVRFLEGERSLGEQTVMVSVRLFRDVYVVRTPQEREQPFDPVQMDTRRVDVLRERDAVAVEDCVGDYTYAVSPSAGRLLTWRDLAKRALVKKGQVIEVAAIDGTMTITTRALAMESGAAGDSIKVRNLTSKKDFTACVVAEARAQVYF